MNCLCLYRGSYRCGLTYFQRCWAGLDLPSTSPHGKLEGNRLGHRLWLGPGIRAIATAGEREEVCLLDRFEVTGILKHSLFGSG